MPTLAQYDNSLESMKAWLKLQASETKGEIKIVSSQDSGLETMLHIDKNPIKLFTPRIGESFAEGENRTIPRVTVSPTLTGCIEGYWRVPTDILSGATQSKIDHPDDPYRQGYVIHAIDYLHALKPSAEMVPSGERAEEHWLVNYDQKFKEYPAKKIGEFYITQLTYQVPQGNASKGAPNIVISGYLKTDGMYFCPGHPVDCGTYMFTVSLKSRQPDSPPVAEPTVVPVSEADYVRNKKLYAALLSHAQPKYLSW
jgi:hypothetical protein